MYSITDVFLMFFLYAFFGWVMEVAYAAVKEKRFVNRGFLNGPICPIYGAGGALVVICLTPLKSNAALLFFCSMVLTSAIELVTGFVLEKIYHTHWWDYSDRKFNIGGYICLQFSIMWGLVCMLLMYAAQPLLYDLVIYRLPDAVKVIAVIALIVPFITDLIATINTLKHLNLRLERVDDAARHMRELSDDIGRLVYEGTEAAVKRSGEIAESEKATELRAELERRQHQLEKLSAEMSLFQARIIKAFPTMKPRRHTDAIKQLRERLRNNTKLRH